MFKMKRNLGISWIDEYSHNLTFNMNPNGLRAYVRAMVACGYNEPFDSKLYQMVDAYTVAVRKGMIFC